jgi:hypothetical protein
MNPEACFPLGLLAVDFVTWLRVLEASVQSFV